MPLRSAFLSPPMLATCLMLALAALAAPTASAEIFVCRTASGVMMTTDHLSTDCLRYGGKDLNADGSVRRLILTPQQQSEQEAQAQQQRQAQEQQRRKLREQRALLTRFPDRAAFEQSQRNDLRTPQSLIAAARQRLQRLADARKALDQEAQFYPAGNYPLELRNKFQENKLLAQQEQALITGQQREIASINAQYAALLPQLKALWARQAGDAGGSAGAP